MQPIAALLTISLLASVACAIDNAPVEQPSSAQPVSSSSNASPAAPVAVAEQQQPAPASSASPTQAVVPSAPVAAAPAAAPAAAAPVVAQASQQQQPQYVHVPSSNSYYQPSGAAPVSGEPSSQVVNKPAAPVALVAPGAAVRSAGISGVNNFEQYGQPESASIPANYKPFGSWGLYIGGDPADGYYTNYYKALGNSVDKHQQSVGVMDQVKPVSSQTAALSPLLRQASSSPYVNEPYYSFAYSPSELHSASRLAGVEQVIPVQAHYSHAGPMSPVQAGAQVYGSPSMGYEPNNNYGVSTYGDFYATKKIGQSAYAQRESTKEAPMAVVQQQQQQQQVPLGQTKNPVYVYQSPAAMGAVQQQSNVAVPQHHQQAPQHQLVAYPVPVGSQIVGSQPGVDGSFSPYGVHAFTRYAVKPTVVSQSSYKQVQYASYPVPSAPAQPQPQQHQFQPHSHQQHSTAYYPFNFYGYPLNQLHYSPGSSLMAPPAYTEMNAPVQSGQVEGMMEKMENRDEKPIFMGQQNRA